MGKNSYKQLTDHGIDDEIVLRKSKFSSLSLHTLEKHIRYALHYVSYAQCKYSIVVQKLFELVKG